MFIIIDVLLLIDEPFLSSIIEFILLYFILISLF
jgi:hypothetical protein